MSTQKQLTTQQQADFPAVLNRFARSRGWVLPFALMAAAFIGAAHLARAPSGTVSAQQPASGSAPPRMTRVAAGLSAPLRALPLELNVEALSVIVAKKYRVSHEATRSMIDMAYREARQNGLDPMLVVAVMAVESRFNPIAQSESGAMGLMQVIPRFHPDKFSDDGKKSIFDPHINIELGAKVLKEYIRRGGTEVAGLQLYNGAAGDPTNAYADKVMAERQKLHEAIRRARSRA
jgi:soluble lytic murein transglycosylase-like protein